MIMSEIVATNIFASQSPSTITLTARANRITFIECNKINNKGQKTELLSEFDTELLILVLFFLE